MKTKAKKTAKIRKRDTGHTCGMFGRSPGHLRTFRDKFEIFQKFYPQNSVPFGDLFLLKAQPQNFKFSAFCRRFAYFVWASLRYKKEAEYQTSAPSV